MESRVSVFFLLFLAVSFDTLTAQEGMITIEQNRKIDSLMAVRIAQNKLQYKTEYFTIQLFYGNYDDATEMLNSFREKHPHSEVSLNFETPNYKVQTGRFENKTFGLKALDEIKRDFPSAFLLARKEL